MIDRNRIFLGCNYNDKKIKRQFDNLKKRIEKDTPLLCVIIDKRIGQPAEDIWELIKENIENSSACVFDVTGFRPNVVLELGYALSIKPSSSIFITFRNRKSKGKIPGWLLTDIGHLSRKNYIHIGDLETYVRSELLKIPYGADFHIFNDKCESTGAPERYQQLGLLILQNIRDHGPRGEQQIRALMSGTACRFAKIISLLKSCRLLSRHEGRHGKFYIPLLEH